MAKGQQKPARDKKKPKQASTSKPKSEYQQRMSGTGATMAINIKK